jgi:hypothetical protein
MSNATNLLPKRGRPGSLIMMEVERELTPGDFAALAMSGGGKLIGPQMIQRLHSRHHRAAQGVAAGKSMREVALLTGYTPQRVSDLCKDPAFSELVATYQASMADANIDAKVEVDAMLIDIAKTASAEIRDRLEDDEQRKQIPLGELRQISQMALDRTVAPPKTATPAANIPTKITFNIGTRDLRPKEIIDVTPDRKEPDDD